MQEQLQVTSDRFGRYIQTVHPSPEDTGHIQLLSENKFGWGMPTDPATEEFVGQLSGAVVMDIGTAWGDAIVIPALHLPVNHVYAMDVTPGHVDESSKMRQTARNLGMSDYLSTYTLDQSWWDNPFLDNPTVPDLLSGTGDPLPSDGSVERMSARHVLQFGDHHTALRVFDLASTALAKGGIFFAVNFTPYTQYMYGQGNGESMVLIERWNQQFSAVEIDRPGGYLHREYGLLKKSISDLFPKKDGSTIEDRGKDERFLLYDIPTLEGLMQAWRESRVSRGLDVDLEIMESYYLAPPRIYSGNKLTSAQVFENMENHVFTLQKI